MLSDLNKVERKHAHTLRKRYLWLDKRATESARDGRGFSYMRAEMAAIKWALGKLVPDMELDPPRLSGDPVAYIGQLVPPQVEAQSWGYNGPGWYFYDETWAYRHGPYKDEVEARSALTRYAASLERNDG